MYKFVIILFALACCIGNADARGGASVNPDAAGSATTPFKPLPASIYVLSGIDPKIEDDSDLAPLDDIIGNAHVVALGEAMHTSGGFHEVRFRVVRHLIRDKGFRVLTLETPRLMSQPLIDFVDDCRRAQMVDVHRLHSAMHAIFSVFTSETMSDMLTWVCRYNMAHPHDAVSFTGFDEQESSYLGPAILNTLSKKGLPASVATARNEITLCADKNIRGTVTLEMMQSCSALIDGELAQLSAPKIAGLSATELTLLKLNLRSLRAHIKQFYMDSLGKIVEPLDYQTRDEEMADIFLTLHQLYWRNAHTIIWAHNTHIERDGLADEQPSGASKGAFRNMGKFLSDNLGDDYKSIGSLAFQLEVNFPYNDWKCIKAGRLIGSRPAELELRLLDHPYLIVDTAAMRNNPSAFFTDDTIYSYSQDSLGPITKEFDGVIYLQNSQAMTTVTEAPCPVMADVPRPQITLNEIRQH